MTIEEEGEGIQNGIVIGRKSHKKKSSVKSRASFRSRNKPLKPKPAHKTKSIDEGSVVRYGPEHKSLFNENKIKHTKPDPSMIRPSINVYHYPATNKSKNSAKTRLLHSSFYLNRHHYRPSGSVQGARTQQTSIPSDINSQVPKKKYLLESLNKGNVRI